jgi:GNAT superfamily N-acetyltransferase
VIGRRRAPYRAHLPAAYSPQRYPAGKLRLGPAPYSPQRYPAGTQFGARRPEDVGSRPLRHYHRRVPIEIKPLTPGRLPDLASLFEQGGDPKWCWCAYFRIRGFDFSSGGKARHRAVMKAAAEQTAADGRAPGLVAYDAGEAVGWVSVGPREDYERLAYSKVLAPVDDKPVWSIVCFVVGKQVRGQGIANTLLDAAIDYAREHGATRLEAYPVDTRDGKRIGSGELYKGTLSMFERAGFKVVERRQWNSTTPVRPIVRKSIRPRRT